MPELKRNIESVLEEETNGKLADVETAIRQKQEELLKAGKDQSKIDKIGEAIIALREEKQSLMMEAAMQRDVKNRIEDLAAFLEDQVEEITEYSDVLVRRLIEKITIYDEMMVVEFKSGLQIEVDE